MGLSIAISGAIVMVTIIFVLFAIPNIVNNIFSIGDASLKASDLRESISQTSTQIMSISAFSARDYVLFSLANNGTEKLWDYEKFTLLITYDADIGGVKTKVTEEFSYDETNSFLPIIEFLRPTSPIISGGWAQENGCPAASAWDCINEVVRSDAEDIATANLNNADQDQVEFALTDDPTPSVVTDVIVRYTYAEQNIGTADPDLIVTLLEGVATIATWTEPGQLPDDDVGYAESSQSLNTLEIASITDYTALSLDFVGDCARGAGGGDDCAGGGGSNDRVTVSWAEVEVQGFDFGAVFTWVISNITNDIVDPRIVNSGESANIVVKLSHQIFANGDVIVLISTDKGVTASSAISAS